MVNEMYFQSLGLPQIRMMEDDAYSNDGEMLTPEPMPERSVVFPKWHEAVGSSAYGYA